MLKIINDQGQTLHLDSNTIVTIERNNSLFTSDDTFAHDITYPGQVGLTEPNKLFILSGHLIESVNSKYEFPVQVMVTDYTFYRAIFAYKIVKDKIQYTLKINFGAVVSKMKTAVLPDIYTVDSFQITTRTGAAGIADLENYMKATCQNPLNYPCVFFPVHNPSWNEFANQYTPPWLNEWDHSAQKFTVKAVSGNIESCTVPFFRLTVLLQKVFEYLKFNVTGGAFNDVDLNQIYVYTRKPLYNSQVILSSLYYLPRLTVIEFLQQITMRLKLSFDFDLLNRTVRVETPQSILSSSQCQDISRYVESVDEMSIPEGKGYNITLKIDESDEAQNRGTDSNKIFTPNIAVVIGDGENKIEMDVGTLANKQETDYSYPITDQLINSTHLQDLFDWPFRLLKFKGMKPVSGGKVFPEALPLDLDGSDTTWYRFLNDAKKITVTAKIPAGILMNMAPSAKFSFKSKEKAYVYALPEKITFPIGAKTSELISVKIQARTLVSNFDTKYYIDHLDAKATSDIYQERYKAFWIPEIHGFTKIRVERVPLPGSAATFSFTPIDSPTDDGGVGGTIGTVTPLTGTRPDVQNSEARLFSPVKPSYYVAGGFKGTFNKIGDYYVFDNPTALFFIFKDKPIWIVF